MLKIKLKNILYALSIFLFFYICFKNSKLIAQSVKNSLFLCYNVVIPSLFLFMVFAFYISNSNVKEIIGLPFIPIFKLLKIYSTDICGCIILSYISGFSVGGFFLSYIKGKYNLDGNALGVLSVLMCNNSPAFVIMAVGSAFFNNYKIGILLFAAIVLSGFLTAFFLSFIFSYVPIVQTAKADYASPNILESINRAVAAILNICGTVILASVVCKVISLYTLNPYILFTITGLTEVTTACVTCFDLFGSNIYLFCIALCVSPLSALLQIKYFLGKALSLKILLLSKILHIPLSLIIVRILINLFPQLTAVCSNPPNVVQLCWNSAPISGSFFIFILIFIIFLDKNITVFTKRKK